jgi:hypothetical protein
MNRYLLLSKDGPLASIPADSYDEANAIALADHGPFGWALQPYDQPYGPFAPANKPEDRNHVFCQLKRDWRVRELVDLGPGRFYRWRVRGQNMNVAPTGADFEFSWDVPSIDDPRYDFDHAARYVLGPWRVRVLVSATPYSSAYERIIVVQAHNESSAGWMARNELYTVDATVIEVAPVIQVATAA